ncbi:MAG: hypothetical protein WBL47_04910 [Bacilli bacterium]|jgi:hypothetical protein|nr:hypothetical protein [Bacillota bacterium]NLM31700.1 hypothetical protein [Acholeplasmataceae bacterium]HOA77876.1 hypothetical protein [Bacilli bacterium]HPZ27584.1 hypothetical protein [Bacilli bacterium]HQC88890.1 hypothetical protein [Bacilli bacterium]
MKRAGIVFLLLCFFLMGIIAGKPTRDTASQDLKERLDDFEKEIVTPGNEYTPVSEEKVDPNLSNSLAKQGENIINGIFDVAFKLIKNILE